MRKVGNKGYKKFLREGLSYVAFRFFYVCGRSVLVVVGCGIGLGGEE